MRRSAVVNVEDKEELALTLDGKKKKLSLQQFLYFGSKLVLNEKKIKGVFKCFENSSL